MSTKNISMPPGLLYQITPMGAALTIEESDFEHKFIIDLLDEDPLRGLIQNIKVIGSDNVHTLDIDALYALAYYLKYLDTDHGPVNVCVSRLSVSGVTQHLFMYDVDSRTVQISQVARGRISNRTIKYWGNVRISQDETVAHTCCFPELPGLLVAADTLAELLVEIKGLVELHLEESEHLPTAHGLKPHQYDHYIGVVYGKVSGEVVEVTASPSILSAMLEEVILPESKVVPLTEMPEGVEVDIATGAVTVDHEVTFQALEKYPHGDVYRELISELHKNEHAGSTYSGAYKLCAMAVDIAFQLVDLSDAPRPIRGIFRNNVDVEHTMVATNRFV